MSDKGTSDTQNTEKSIVQGELNLANKQDARAGQIFDLTMPGLKTSMGHYSDLASGDSNAIFKAVAPGVQAIDQQFDSQKKNISDNMPRGGSRDLAMAETDVSKAGSVGNMVNQSYEGSFAALANLAGKGVGLSISEVQNAISAFGGASNTAGNLANQQEAGKASMMGMIGSLAGDGATLGAAGMA